MLQQELLTARREIDDAMDSVSRIVVGKRDVIRLLFAAVLAGGHCLIEDVPGVGKTLLAKAVAAACGCQFQRIQFTPDLLPSDITGVSMYDAQSRHFEFRPGPIFGQVVLADELNRSAPRTQSALLEAMEEGTVTVDGTIHRLPRPFLVIATQNPLTFDATYPLPEAQLDRFMVRIRIGYPSGADEMALLDAPARNPDDAGRTSRLSAATLAQWQANVQRIHVDSKIKQGIVQLLHKTRNHPSIVLGASPRAGIALLAAAKASALMDGREYVIPDDIFGLVEPVLAHRMLLSPTARVQGVTAEAVLHELVAALPVPGVSDAQWWDGGAVLR